MMYDSAFSFNSFSLLTFFSWNHCILFILPPFQPPIPICFGAVKFCCNPEEQTLLLWLVQCLAGKQAEGELITQTYNSSLSHLQQARHHGKYLNMMIKKTETGKKKSSMVLWRAARPTAANTIWRSTGLQMEYYVSVCARLSSVSGSTQTYSRWGK